MNVVEPHSAAASHSGSFSMEENMQWIYTVEFEHFNDSLSKSKTAAQAAEKNKQEQCTADEPVSLERPVTHRAGLQTSHTSLCSSVEPSMCCDVPRLDTAHPGP